MKRNKESTNYSIEVDLTKIMDRDEYLENESRWDDLLFACLNKIEGVDNADYNGHFGHFVFLRIDGRFDNEKTWTEIEKVISEYMK